MTRKIEDYLGNPASVMLVEEPFKDWMVTKDIDDEIESLTYEFDGKGLEVHCDPHNDLIFSIFVYCDAEFAAENLIEVSCEMSRAECYGV